MRTRFAIFALAIVSASCWLGARGLAAEPAKPDAKPAAAKPAAAKAPDAKSAAAKPASVADEKLDAEQAKLAAKYAKLEKTFARLAELEATTDPKQAALLRQAFAESRSRLIDDQLSDLAKQLAKDQLYAATKGQVKVQQDLGRLLEILQSGDSAKRDKSERELIHNILGRIDKMIKEQEGMHGETEGDGDLKQLAERQGKEADKAKEVAGDIRQLEPKNADDASGSDSKNGGKQGDKNSDKSGGGKKGDKNGDKPGDKSGDKSAGKSGDKPGDKPEEKKGDKSAEKAGDKSGSKNAEKPSEKPGDKSSGKPGEKSGAKPGGKSGGKSGQPKGQGQGQGQGKDQDQDQNQGDQQNSPAGNPPGEEASPARQRVKAAEEEMRKAQKHLEEANRKGAAKEQAEAVARLQEAKAELEKILRQLREEEVERVLAQLEGRFRHMLTLQIEVYEGTVRVDKIPQPDRGHDEEVECGRLSRNESAIVVEADRALNLLHEEGSSVAFPEAVDQMRDDMQQVSDRLAALKVESITQGVEEDIIASLQETIIALQKAQKEHKARKGRQGKGGGGMQQDDPLVDQIAELKMIRALQVRVNTRTKRYSKLLEGDAEQADRPDLVEALKHLGEREDRIHEVTHDIVVGKNR